MADGDSCPHGLHRSYCVDCIEGPSLLGEQTERAVREALELAPEVASATPGDSVQRGIDVGFDSQADAEYARAQVDRSLESSKWAGLVSAWVWTPGSSGDPLCDAGKANGREIRLQPQYKNRPDSPSDR